MSFFYSRENPTPLTNEICSNLKRARRLFAILQEIRDGNIPLCQDYSQQYTQYKKVSLFRNNFRIHIGKDFVKDGLLPLIEVLKNDTHIEVLDFRGAKIGASGCVAIQTLLENNTTIRKIDLTGNNIDFHGAQALASGLKKNNTLKELTLRNNLISRKGAYHLAEAMKINTGLTKLDVSNCFLGYLGSTEIERSCLKRHIELNVTGNYVREEFLNALTHFLGIVFALVGGYFMIGVARQHSWPYLIGCCIFVFSLFLLMTCSVLAHGLHWMERTGRLFALLDHAMIAVFIAASYSPFLLVSLGHTWIGWMWMIIIWLIAVICIILSFAGPKYAKIELFMFLLMGWISMFLIRYLLACVPSPGLILLACGGLSYSIGVFFFVKGQTVPIYHAIWHLFVLFATIAHYFAVLLYIDHCEIIF